MIIILKHDATDENLAAVVESIEALKLRAHISRGAQNTIVGVIGATEDKETLAAHFENLDGVERVMPISRPYKLVSKEGNATTSVRLANGVTFGGRDVPVCAGPCSVESREQLEAAASAVAAAGAAVLRGGAFKPRTSPYAFQGMGEEGLKLLREIGDRHGLAVVTEVMDVRDVGTVAHYADMLQIGARNMQNFNLLREVGMVHKPVLLKRGLSATIEEWLMAAEYIYAAGNHDVVLCERGIRSYDPSTRNTLDLAAVPLLHSLTHLPVVVDPSHGTGVRNLVKPMALAGIAAGADGLIIEVHPNPAVAVSDGPQSLTPPGFADLMEGVRAVALAVGRTIAPAPSVV